MVNQDDSFIREVNEELRSDQMRLVWKRFGRILIAAAVLVVLGTIGKVGYEYWRDSEASAAGDNFLAALTLAREGKNDEALAALTALEKDGFGAYPVLARMRSASLLAATDTQGAVNAFSAIAKDSSVPEAVRDAARLRAAYLLVDTGTYEQVSAEVEQLATPQSALRHSAREVLGLSAYKHEDYARAKEWFDAIINDSESPRNVANRAQMLLDLISASGKLSS
ncbi:tetratricopeptide repeat protein [Shinella sp. CPCC 101442]|uniref:tetratricopeptide repeat protein n=1 Tax=Shinella sp. CPCC 101442 TaxID=2932265 RepID=UPI0021539524|nr:tetratricopeptide repeat protein [Shinella sp. CPCC 101442]MCR6500318.1 tetratricopeptide repeat protein [Shinella sp. CPCC 101442]